MKNVQHLLFDFLSFIFRPEDIPVERNVGTSNKCVISHVLQLIKHTFCPPHVAKLLFDVFGSNAHICTEIVARSSSDR